MNELIETGTEMLELFSGFGPSFYAWLFFGSVIAWILTYFLLTNCPLVYLVDKKDGTRVGYGLRGRTTDDWDDDEEESEDEEA